MYRDSCGVGSQPVRHRGNNLGDRWSRDAARLGRQHARAAVGQLCARRRCRAMLSCGLCRAERPGQHRKLLPCLLIAAHHTAASSDDA